MAVTKTIGPLHLEDLEPHRFEDLIRQLLYDFRPWRSLEATGRSGSDDGFDARATETVAGEQFEREADQEAEADRTDIEERIWLVQCKRERVIGPKKLVEYLDAADPTGLYGMVFAAACDFSKTARDGFRERARELGFAEAYLWGKGEIEDLLFQPKNDHLLFAYFGVSLQVRRRTLKTAVRATLATKRKAIRLLREHELQPVLLRDATDHRYPYMDPDKSKQPIERRRWNVMNYKGAFHDGLHFILHQYRAYLSDDGVEWDYAELDDTGPVNHDNPWYLGPGRDERWENDSFEYWDALPEQNKASLEVVAVLPYDNILDIDEHGDEYFDKPHIYTTEFGIMEPFCGVIDLLKTNDRWAPRWGEADEKKRVRKFPRRDD